MTYGDGMQVQEGALSMAAAGLWGRSVTTPQDASVVTQIWHTVLRELADLPDVAQMTAVVLRLSLAVLLGGVLGWQREASGKDAGLRTHMLVAMGAAMFMLLPQLMGAAVSDGSRVLQGLIAGVGFLGAGTILKTGSDGQEAVRGLTTAAGIWFTAAIGAAVGSGEELAAILCTALALLVLTQVPRFSRAATPEADRASSSEQD